jgi:hypothetical protein
LPNSQHVQRYLPTEHTTAAKLVVAALIGVVTIFPKVSTDFAPALASVPIGRTALFGQCARTNHGEILKKQNRLAGEVGVV